MALLAYLITKDTFLGIKPLRQIELKFIDDRFQKRGEINVKGSSNIVIVEINDESYKQIPYRWPWPRFILAKAVDNLTKAGAKVIGVDIQLFKEDENPSYDSLFREAVRKSGRVVLAGKLDFEPESRIDAALRGNIDESLGKQRAVVKKKKETFNNIFCDTDSLLSFVNIPEDIDQAYRFYTPFIFTRQTDPPRSIPTFGLAVVNKYLGLPSQTVVRREEGKFLISDIEIPAFTRTDFIVNLYGTGSSFLHHHFYEIVDDKDVKTQDEIDLQEELNTWEDPDYQKLFKDKIVLIGSTSVEDKDLLSVAFAKGDRSGANTMFGIEYHANVIQNILSKDFLYTPSEFITFLFLAAAALAVFYLSNGVKKIKIKSRYASEGINFVLVIALVFGVIWVSQTAFTKFSYILSTVSISTVIVLSYLSNTAYHFIKERKQNVMIKGMFSHYVSHNVVDQLLSDPDKLKLGGERKNLTILFSDIAGFTTFSETKTPEDLVKFINTFLSEMTEVILRNQGTLDKYIGDAIMAFWGAPIVVENHAALACRTACEMQERVKTLQHLAGENFELKFRMGINSGDVIVGNIGGTKRFDYTVIGDAVNLASRLEGVNKEFGTNIIIGEDTQKILGDGFLIRELDRVKVKGKKKPTSVYELVGMVENEAARKRFELMKHYFEGLNYYREKSFADALHCFRRSVELSPADTPSHVYIDRINYFMQNPPDENWDGVFEMKTK